MTLDNIMNICNDNMTIIEDNTVVARYDGRNSIPIEYNDREVWKIESIPIGTELFIYIE